MGYVSLVAVLQANALILIESTFRVDGVVRRDKSVRENALSFSVMQSRHEREKIADKGVKCKRFLSFGDGKSLLLRRRLKNGGGKDDAVSVVYDF